MKKIFDFLVGQIMIIIAILVTIGLFYLLYVYSGTSLTPAVFYEEVEISNYQVIIDLNTGMLEKDEILKIDFKNIATNQTFLKIDSVWKVSLLVSILLTLILDCSMLMFYLVNNIILFFQKIKYKKIIKEKFNLSDESLCVLPNYEAIIANAIYKKKYQYEMIVARFEYYYKINGFLDKNNNLKEELNLNINSLSELERMIMKKLQKNKEETKKLTRQEQDAEYYKNRREFKNKIDEILKERRYYREDIVKTKVNAFFEAIKKVKGNKEYFLKSEKVLRNFLIFIAFGILISIVDIAMLLAIIFGIWLFIKYIGISLTEEGELERAKIIFLIDHLKKKKLLSDEEKYFLTMLTKY